jgi:regulatory protein
MDSAQAGGDDDDQAPGDPEAVARLICLRLLEQRARTRSELETALRRKGVPDDAGRVVLDRFEEVGLVDDAGFADAFAATQHTDRGLSRRAVAAKLRTRGVEEATIERAVEVIDRDSERVEAERLVRRKLKSVSDLDRATQIRRLTGLLGRKGYAGGLAYEVVRDVLAAADDEDGLNGADEPTWEDDWPQ